LIYTPPPPHRAAVYGGEAMALMQDLDPQHLL
jgi:hypothetical protein